MRRDYIPFIPPGLCSEAIPTAGKHFYICENLPVGHGESSSGVLLCAVVTYLYISEREKENFRITVSCQYFGCSSCIVDVDMGDLLHSAFLPAHFHPSLGSKRV